MSNRIFILLISLFFISWVSQAQPITQATAIKIIPVNGTATPPTTTTPFRFDWTAGTGTNNIIVVIRDSTRSFTPVNNTQYTANPDFSLGTNLGSGSGTAKVVYNGLSSALTVTDIINLQAGTTYLIRIYEYSGTLLGGNNDESYNLNPASGNPIYFKYHTATPAGKWWTPPGVTAATVQAWGAGGGGGGTAVENSSVNGGGGGAYASSPLTGLSGGYTITVGSGGGANETTGGQGVDGGNSVFGSSLVVAVGGDGGGTGSTTGGFGGGGTIATAETAASTGVTRHAGGNGNSRIAGANTGGGGGGGSAGTTGAGQLGGAATAGGIGGLAGVAGANGGAAGGAGGDDGAIGVAGSFPGGGGGGQGYQGSGTTGSGAGGLVIVSYQPSASLTSTASFTKNFIKNTTAQTVQVNFSAPVTGTPTITIDGDMSAPLFTNQVMTIGGDASVWTFNAGSTWANNGEVFKVTVGTATNSNGTEVNPTPASNSFTVDNTAPTVSLTSSDGNLIVRDANTVTITATFVEANGLSGTPTISIPSTVTPVSGANMTGGGLSWSYSWNVPAGNDASVSVSISATDNAGNANTAATGSVTYTIDNIAPTSDQDAIFTASITKKGGTAVTLTGVGSSTEFCWFAPSGTTTFVAGPTMTTAAGDASSINAPANEGAYRLFVLDAAGNLTAQSTAILTVDNTGPAIVISAPSAVLASNSSSITYTITYTDADNITLANGDVTLNTTGGASATKNVTGTGTLTRTVTLTNFTGNGTVGISIAAGTAVDLYTNLSLAAGPSATITVDNSAPTNQDVVFPASKASVPGAAVTIVSSGTATNRVWVAPVGTSVFVEGPTMTKSVNGTFLSILAPATEGSYRVYVLDELGNASAASTAILHVFTQATNLTYAAATINPDDRINFNWNNGTGGNRIVLFKTGGSDYVPTGDLSGSVNLDYNAGADLDATGTGQVAKIVFSGSGSGSIEVLGLAGATTYTIEVYEFAGAFVYLSPPLTDTRSTIHGTNPSAAASGMTFTNISSNSITVQFNQGAANTGTASMLIARAGSAVTFNPADGVSYTPNSDYSAGTDLGGGTKIIAQRLDADGAAIVVSGLLADTDYHFAVVNFNGAAGTGAENYGLGGAIVLGNRNTEPSTLANGFSFTSVGETGMTLNWSGNGNGDGRVVLIREGTAVTDQPTDNTTYTANGNFGFGNPPTASQIGSSYMVYDGTGSNASVTNLKPNTTYHFAIYEYNNTTTQGTPNKVYGAIATTPGQITNVDVTAPVPPALVGALTVVGGKVVTGFWNSTNTQLQVVVPLPTSDGTIDGGTIQIRLKMTGGAFANIPTSGVSSVITTAERVAGSKTVTVDAAHLENVATGFTEGNRSGLVASENKFMLIGAKVSDLAGNPSADYAQSATQIDVDQTPPQIFGTVTFSDGAGGAESVTMKFTEPIGLNNNDDPLIGTPGWSTTPATTISTGGAAKYTTADSTLVLASNANNDWTSATTITYTQGGAGNFIMDDLAGNEMQTVTKTMTDVVPPFLITGMVFNPNGAGKETITFNLSESLSLNENDLVTGFTPSVGSFDPALTRYTGKGTTNTITLTSSANNQWPTDGVTIAYSGAGNVTDAFSLQLPAFGAEPILLKSIHIASNNALAPTAWAKLNDLVTVTFTTSRTLAGNPAVTIGGQTAAFISLVGSDYTYRYNTAPDVLVNGGLAITITANETGPPAKQTFAPVTTDGSAITYDKTAPASPPNLDFGFNDPTNQDTGTSSTDNYTSTSSSLYFSGTGAETGSTVRIFNSGSQIGSFANTTAGAWNITVPTLSQGVYVITARAMDAAGNEGPPSTALTPSLTIDNTVVAPTAFDLHVDDDSGVSDLDNITNQTTGLSISGTSENFATIEIWEGTQLVTTPATITANGSGVWTADIDLAEGVHNITAKQIDRAGNISAVNGVPLVITVDVTAPSASAKPDLDTNDDTGVSGTDYVTKNTSGLSFSSSPIEANAYVQIFKDGIGIGTEYSFQANGSGNWSGDVSLAEGVYSITTIVTDAAGNPSVASTGQIIEIDDTPPTLDPRSIASSGLNPLFAKAGDVVTVSFTADEPLANSGLFVPTGNIDSDPLTFDVDNAPDYTAFITTDGTNTQNFLAFSYTVYDLAGNSTTNNTVTDGSSVKFDNTPPAISTIVVTAPPTPNAWSTSNGTGVNTVTYTVTFTEPVIASSVNPGDFVATGLGYAGFIAYPLVSGSVFSVATVSPTVYTVTVSGVINTGQLRLDLRATATILDLASINSIGGYTGGPTYSLVLPEPTNIQGTPTATTNGTASVTVNWINSIAVQTPTHLIITATGPDNQDPAVTPAEFIPTDGNTAIALRALPPEDSNFSDGKGLHIVNLTGALSTSYQFTTLLSGKTYTFKFYPVTLSPNNSAFPDNSNYLLTGIKSASATTQTASEGSIAAGSIAPPATIGSLTTAFGSKNFTFKLDDDGLNSGADVSKTVFNTLTIKAGGGNTVANWQNVIAEAELKTTTEAQTITTTNIVGNTIIFSTAITNDAAGELDDNEEKEYELRIRLKSSMLNGADSTVDNQIFDFYVDNSSFAFEAASSQFNGTESETSGSSFNKVTVVADRLVAITQPPPTALVSINVAPRAKLKTRDANGNTDLDYVKNVKITNAQSLPMNGLLASDSLPTVAGVIRLPLNFQYADDGTGAANNGTLTVTGKASTLTNTNSVVLSNTTVSYSATTTITTGPLGLPSFIQSTTTNPAAPIAVFDFKINDDNNSAGDGSPTRITKIVITQGSSGNDIGTWTDLIQDAELVYTSTLSGNGTIPFSTGVVNATNITFDLLTTGVGGEGYIADNDSKTYTLRIYLKTSTVTPALIDNRNLTFRMTNTASNITLGTLSSNMAASDFSSDALRNEIKVDAAELRIVTQPVADILVNKDINLQPGQSSNPAVQVTDIYGNRDLDFGDIGTQTITITNAQSLPMSNVVTLPVDGLLTFANNFQYDGVGVGPTGNGTLTFTRAGLTGVGSQTVTVRVATSATITAGATTEAATIASIVDTDPEKVEIFDFTISDDPGLADNNIQNDGNPIQITKIIITQNPAVGTNTVSTWSDAIAAAFLSDGTNTLAGTISATDITFGSVATPIPNAAGQLGYIADGTFSVPSNKTYNLIIYLKPSLGGLLPETIDGLKFGFNVTAGNIATLTTGTLIIGSENENSDPASAGKGEVDVDATVIHFTTIPSSASVSVNISPTVVAKARDVNGNRDLDFDNQVITAFGNTPVAVEPAYGTINGPVINSTDQFNNGIFTFNTNFQFTSGAAATQFTLSAGGIFGISPPINVISSFESRVTAPKYKDLDGITLYELADSIPYVNHQSATLSDSYEVIQLVVADGTADGNADGATLGVPGDLDGAPTILTELKIGVTNYTAIRKIAAYNDAGIKIADGNIVQVGASILGEVTFDFTGNEIIAADDTEELFKIRATFQSSPTLISDTMHIRVSLRGATLGVGSKFYDVPPLSNTYLVGNPRSQVTAPADKNRLEVVATSLDFIKQPGNFSGIDQPIDINTADTTGIVHARDKFAVVDLNYNRSVTVSATANPNSYPSTFTNGVLDLSTMRYSTPGDGTLTVTTPNPNGLSSNNTPWGTSITAERVDVINVTASQNTNGVLTTPNLKGGNVNQVIFGFTFNPQHVIAKEPKLKGFSITFKDDNGNPYYFKTAGSTVLKNFKILESTTGSVTGAISVAGIATITQARSLRAAGAPFNAPATSFDMVTVVFDPVSNYRPIYNTSRTYYLQVDVDVSTNIGTPAITPYLENGGYSDIFTRNNVLLTEGSAKLTTAVKGQTRSFASTKPPELVSSSPFNGQLNVDTLLNTITLFFDVPVTTFDGKAFLYDRYSNTLVATLTAANGNYSWAPGQSISPSPYITNPLVFNLPGSFDLKPDSVYYLTIPQGRFDPNNPVDRAGLSDDGFNLFGGISFNGTLYFKAASKKPPVMKGTDDANYYFSKTTTTINASFNQRGTAYYMITNTNPTTPPNNAQIKGASYTGGTIRARGSFEIAQIEPSFQYGTVNTNLTPGQTYDVFMFAENDALPNPIGTNAPYGSSSNGFVAGTTGPTLRFTAPPAPTSLTNFPRYQICSNSYTQLSDPIIISEVSNGQFSGGAGVVQTINLLLPTDFQFDVHANISVQFNGANFDETLFTPTAAVPHPHYEFINTTILKISFVNNGATTPDNIIISDLMVIASAPDKTGFITRFSGNGIPAISDNTQFAQITSAADAPINFTNSYSNVGNFDLAPISIANTVTYIPDNYVDVTLNQSAARLFPQPPSGDYGPTFFTGSGLTNDILNLTAVPLNTGFNITLSHTDMNGCISTKSDQYTVYNHKNAIASLGTPSILTGERQVCIKNQNFPAPATNPIILSDSVSADGLAGYKLIQLFANIPTKATASSQIIFGPDWQALVSNIPVQFSAKLDANTGQTYRTYNWNYNHILNANSLSGGVLNDPYSNFIQPPTPRGKTYYKGGSLGIIEFTGKYHSKADFSVFIPVRQEVEVFIPAIPVVEHVTSASFTTPSGTLIYCEGIGSAPADILINGYPAASPGSSTGFFTLRDSATLALVTIPSGGFTDNSNGTSLLKSSVKNNYRTIRVDYTYQDIGSPCSATGSFYIRITPNPRAKFMAESVLTSANPIDVGRPSDVYAYCENNLIKFINTSTFPVGSEPYFANRNPSWALGDPLSATNNQTTDTAKFTYSANGRYIVTYSVRSQYGCPSQVFSDSIYIGAIPNVAFSMNGISTATDVNVLDKSTVIDGPGTDSQIFSAEWKYSPSSAFTPVASNLFTTPGHYTITLRSTTQISDTDPGGNTLPLPGCQRTITRDVIIVPAVSIAAAGIEVTDNFESDDILKQWQTSSTNSLISSWERDDATETSSIELPSHVWGTNLDANLNNGNHNPGEVSFLYSPSFDLSNLIRPKVSFDYVSFMEVNDGVVLEFSTDTFNIADPLKKWYRIGTNVDGNNWYNRSGLASKPGTQVNVVTGISSGDYGWSAQLDTVLHAQHTISPDIPAGKRSHVIFRFALASLPGSSNQGFTLDNFRVGERTRVVLIENFTNAGNSHSVNGLNVEFKESDFLKQNFNGVGTDIVKINYHVGFPSLDPFNDDYPADPSARALYYNIGETPLARMDGGKPNDPQTKYFSEWGVGMYNIRTLKLAQAELDITTPVVSATGGYEFSVTVTAKKLLSLDTTILHVAFVEGSIPVSELDDPAMIATGETTFDYVLKKMVPSALGTRFNTTLQSGQSKTFGPFEWTPELGKLYNNDKKDLAIVAFLQNEVTKEVYQAEILTSLTDPGEVTEAEDPDYERNISLFPNPANHEVNIHLPVAVSKTTPVEMFDTYGKSVYRSTFKAGEQTKTVSTSELAGGIYFIQMSTPDGNIARRKVMVVHR